MYPFLEVFIMVYILYMLSINSFNVIHVRAFINNPYN